MSEREADADPRGDRAAGPGGYAHLGPGELAAEYRSIATERATSWAEADEQHARLEAAGAEMDRRGVRLPLTFHGATL